MSWLSKIFGGKKVPELMRGLGQGIKEFKKGMEESLQADKTSNENKEKDNSLEESK